MATCSFADRVKMLQAGQTETRSERLRIGDDSQDANDVMQKLRLSVNPTVSRLRANTGSEFKVESGMFLSNDVQYIIVNVCVTCLSGGAAENTLDGDEDDDI